MCMAFVIKYHLAEPNTGNSAARLSAQTSEEKTQRADAN